ncbi:hypothetical protein H2200_011397 [Cladophialophora chaetospira]|uniref:Uncharacterized protein n=1 Tax=Cladophialophora chaetospira TaxID=386627 RepID=A0AA39CD34_9EURO|nr:hypothetical protein H2200_011397 [Cladophialophora chaetospira]
MMECVAHTEHNAHQPRVQFVFQSKFTPLWDVDMIYRFLSPWRWVQPQEGKMHPIRFPRRIRIRLDENGEKAFSFKVSSEGQPVQVFLQARLEEDLKTWWDAFSREQPKARFKRLILDPEDEQVWPMGLGGLTINDMEIS